MLRTACREAEALRLCVEDVDFERGLVRFESRKGERPERVKAQDVPMDDGLRAQLVAYGRVGRGGEPYFIVRGGRFMTHTSLRRALERASRAAGISPAITGLGWLKNKAVTMLGEVGVRAEVTARIANHASVKTTERHYDSAVLWEQRKAGLAALGVALDRFCTAPPNSTGFSTGQDSKAPETSQSSLAKSET
jgi:integrase